jgi:hypothetical protein
MTAATTSPPAAPLRLDWLLPEFDATIVEHQVIEGEPEAIYRAITTVDMAEIPKQHAAVRVLFAARGAAARLVNALLGRPTPAPLPEGALRLGDMPEHGDWVKLADDPPDEFAFGVVGRFWGGETVWETIDADHFVAFDEPGLAKIACSLSLRPYGTAHTLVSYEARTQALDPESRAHFLRYWRVVRAGVAIVMRAFLHAVAKEVSDANPDP